MAGRNQNSKDDFDAPALAKQVEDHTKDMASIVKRLDDIESKFGTIDKIGDTVCNTISRDTTIQEKLEGIFTKTITSNESIKKAIIELINKEDRNWLAVFGRRVAHSFWSLLMIAVGVVITVSVQNYLHPQLPVVATAPANLSPAR